MKETEEAGRASAQPYKTPPKPLGLIWIACPYPVVCAGLISFLKEEGQVFVGLDPPEDDIPSYVLLSADGADVSEGIERVLRLHPQALVLVLSLDLDPSLARTALKAGASGYIHARMTYEQMIAAFKVISADEIVAPKVLREHLTANEEEIGDLDMLTTRQREILELVGEGMTNLQIAEQLFLTESTVKQHLRGAYKILGVNNRVEATKLILSDG
jgi:DNA-binding NarL/FixJ family response regulator